MAFRILAKLLCYLIYIGLFYMVATTPQSVYIDRKTTCTAGVFAFELFKAAVFAVVSVSYGLCFFWEDFPDPDVRIFMKVGLFFLTLTQLLRLFYVLPSDHFWVVVTFSIIVMFITRALLLPRRLYY